MAVTDIFLTESPGGGTVTFQPASGVVWSFKRGNFVGDNLSISLVNASNSASEFSWLQLGVRQPDPGGFPTTDVQLRIFTFSESGLQAVSAFGRAVKGQSHPFGAISNLMRVRVFSSVNTYSLVGASLT
jgi:hypothetical protein